jgi:3,4-dihydroxy 2-butanone 4-phosphate synthase / GTP cyclohydrolase II
MDLNSKNIQTPDLNHTHIGTIHEAIEDLKAGKFIIVVDDIDRENEGDLVYPAELVTPEVINFYETYVRGWICVAMASQETDRLELELMVNRNTERHGTAFTVTVDAAEGTSTGISAEDQAHTISLLASPDSKPHDFLRPGHVRPLRARAGGVLERSGHTESVVDLMKLSGYHPVGILCEIKNPDGSMARLPQLTEYAKKHDLRIYTIESLIAYRLLTERLVKRVAEAEVNTKWGVFKSIGYESVVRDEQHLALVFGDLHEIVSRPKPALVRVHHAHVLCDIFGVRKPGSIDQIDSAMKKIVENGSGVFVFIRSRLRGKRMISQLQEMAEPKQDGAEIEFCEEIPPEHEMRDYGLGAQIIHDLGITKMRILTDHPKEMVGLKGYGIEIEGHVELSKETGK